MELGISYKRFSSPAQARENVHSSTARFEAAKVKLRVLFGWQ